MDNNGTQTTDLATIPDQLAVFDNARAEIKALADRCKDFIISDSSITDAEKLAKEAKSIEKLIEDKRKEITAPILERKREIDSFAKDLTKELDDGIGSLRSGILTFKQEQERKRLEEQRRLAEEQRKKEEALRAKVKEEGSISTDDLEELEQIKSQELAVSAAPSTKGLVKKWTYDVIDESKVPAQFLMVNDKAVKAAIAEGARSIPGLKIYQTESLRLG